MNDYMAFTYSPKKMVNRLITPVHVCSKFTVTNNLSKVLKMNALWDTGATSTCISENVAKSLDLIPLGVTKTSTANGDMDTSTYYLDVILPNNVTVEKLIVTEVDLKGCDLLIGMDVIKHGDFSITNYKNETVFSFRIPSVSHVDYVLQQKQQQVVEEEIASANPNGKN